MAINPKIIQPVAIIDATTATQQAGVDTAGRLQTTSAIAPGAAALTGASISFSASGDNSIVAGVASQTTKVYRLIMTVAGATTITFKNGAGTSLTGAMNIPAGGGSITLDFTGEPWFVTSTNTAFIINSSAAVQCSGRVYYITS